MLKNLKTVFNQMHYKKTVNIAGTYATFRLVTFCCLVTHFYCEPNVRRFARGDCTLKFIF